jgi:carbon storage regulator
MLVLSRKRNEVIRISTDAGNIELMVVDIRGDQVRLGITAPSEIPVHRLEVAAAIEREIAARENIRYGT